ncbi:MAG: mechanosensitive ion channel [Bacteroidales bacterium]|nr:mechanosensitive ion channel [Candidatus Physcousia equi]
MKKLLIVLFALCSVLPMQAVLKEKDLSQTLSVLRAELKSDYEKQQQFMQRYASMNAEQHSKLITYMKRSEQIGLILYSQKADFTFDMAYACQQATELYRTLTANTIPYDRIKTRLKQEIERYTELITLLKQMPPAIAEQRDSILAVDSLYILHADSLDSLKTFKIAALRDEKKGDDPYLLTGQDLTDRKECLYYAQHMLDNLVYSLEAITREQGYYDEVSERVNRLNEFAQSRYSILRRNIFQDGGSNYFQILFNLPRQWMLATNDFQNKYKPLGDSHKAKSEWRGMYVVFISLFIVIYITISSIISNIIVRWLLPKRWKGRIYKQKRQMIINSLGVLLFTIAATVARAFTNSNIVLMATSLMITFAWLMLVIFLSLLFRLDGNQMKSGARAYIPFISMALVVIIFRIILIPNNLVNLIYPPILLVFTIWQWRTLKKHKQNLPNADMFYSTVSLIAMVIATITAWIGYTLLAVEIMMWWMFQLTAIQTITCFYDMLRLYERRRIIYRLAPELKVKETSGEDISKDIASLEKQIKRGEFIGQTWMYDFIHRAMVPVMAVLSLLLSIYWAAEIFEMTSLCISAFMFNFLEVEGVVTISLAKIVLVTSFWFLFSYFSYLFKALYHHIRRKTLGDNKEDYNGTLANNIISILCWGGFFIFTLVLLKVPSSGISIVTAGLATGMGFAMKDLMENFFYGISLMSGRVRVGDYIECDNIRGKVEKITYQSTSIQTMDGCVMAFLNSALFSKNFKNLTRNHQYEYVKIPVGVAYGSNINEVRQMLLKELEPLRMKTNAEGKTIIDEQHPISVAFSDFGDSSVDLLVCIWLLVEDSIAFRAQIKEIIYNTLNKHKVNIPFPQRDIYIHQVQ